MCTSSWRATANPRRSGSSSKPGAPAGSRRCSRNVSVHSPHMIPRPRRFARNGGLSVEAHSMSTTRKALRRSSTTYARHKIMQINLNPTCERGASRDAVDRPRETLGDSHLISSDPHSRFGLVCDLLCCRGNTLTILSRPEALNASGSKRACRMAISRNACSLLALPDSPEFARAVRHGVPGTRPAGHKNLIGKK